MILAVVVGFLAVYGTAFVIASLMSIDAFKGLLAFDDGTESFRGNKLAFFVSPLGLMAGVFISLLMKSQTDKTQG